MLLDVLTNFLEQVFYKKMCSQFIIYNRPKKLVRISKYILSSYCNIFTYDMMHNCLVLQSNLLEHLDIFGVL
ncbi:hypothetical protein L6452_14560 [Arctium lappa]|uniref:Uncharacterized protein n=1 Tax=Arctium lappa TaxID=4217 RepID=A0ACB9CLE1_ARCLA|nr:hypothetical protein L6452_14560 [Arctium lappa]